MKWTLNVADRASGNESVLELEADSEAAAVKEAGKRGMLVTNIGPKRDGARSRANVGPEIPYRSPDARATRRAAPDPYLWVRLAATVLRVVAIAAYAFGSLLFVLTIVLIARDGPGGDLISGLMFSLMALAPTIGILAGGAAAHMLAEIGLAVRDIARRTNTTPTE